MDSFNVIKIENAAAAFCVDIATHDGRVGWIVAVGAELGHNIDGLLSFCVHLKFEIDSLRVAFLAPNHSLRFVEIFHFILFCDVSPFLHFGECFIESAELCVVNMQYSLFQFGEFVDALN